MFGALGQDGVGGGLHDFSVSQAPWHFTVGWTALGVGLGGLGGTKGMGPGLDYKMFEMLKSKYKYCLSNDPVNYSSPFPLFRIHQSVQINQ